MKSGKLSGRNTRNSQRLVNLSQQEALYQKLGISAMPGNKSEKGSGNVPLNKPSPKEEVIPEEKPVDEQEEDGVHESSKSEDEIPEESPPRQRRLKPRKGFILCHPNLTLRERKR